MLSLPCNCMKIRILFLFASLFCLNLSVAQTVIFTENWNTGAGTWTLNVVTGVEGSDPNFFEVDANEGGGITPDLGAPGSCGVANNGDNTLHVTSVFNPSGGAAYDAGGLCGILFCPEANRRCESPVMNCTGLTNITLDFNYIENGDGLLDNATVWYNDGSGWIQVDDPLKTLTGCGGQGLWTSHSIVLPASADNNPTVQIAFRWVNNDDGVGTDPSFAVDDIVVTGSAAALPVVSITPSPNDSLCQSSTLTLNGSATNGPITAWAWTVNPTTGVAFVPDTAAQNPTVTFTTPGTYTFTLQATNGSGSASTTQTITILPATTPAVTIAATPTNPVCAGTTINFTATATSSGSSPSYQWQVNGGNVGTNSPNFSSVLNNNDVVTVTVTTSDSCAATLTANDSYTVITGGSVVPLVSIAADDSSVCAGTTINFTATPTNGGTTPVYQWQINGVNAGANSPNFSSSTLNNSDTVSVILTSSDPCASPTADTSATIIVTITATVMPTVTVTANPLNPVCAGTTINFTATPTNGGTTPVYQWQLNGANVGTNSPNFSSSSLSNNDTVSVIMTSNDVCPVPGSDTNEYIVLIDPLLTPSATVTPTTFTGCVGDSIVFTADTTNGGTAPVFQWQVNGVNAGTNSSTFTLTPVSGGEQIWVILTSNATCATPATVTSNTVNVTANPLPVLSVSQHTTTVCPNVADSLFASANAGSTFSWTPAGGLNTTTNDTVLASNAITGTYTYYVIATLNGCTSTDSIQVIVANTFSTTAGAAITICSGDSANLSVAGGTTWTWTPTGDLNCSNCQNPVATPVATGTVTNVVTYTAIADLAGCLDTVTQTVTVIPNASAAFNTTIISQGLPQVIGFTNNSINANTFFWTLGNGNTSVLQTPANQTYNVAGAYTVTLIAYGLNGCNDTLPTVIMVNDTIGITVPNIFTPNGDEINDVWQPSVHGATSFECVIYNRYGVLVYEFFSGQDKWDGHTTSGSVCNEGTYYYILKATDLNNKSYDLKGFIQLIR